MQSLIQDLRYAIRMLVKNRGFTTVAVLSIGLGIAANTTVFSIVNTLRFRPLPFKEPNQLVDITEIDPERGGVRLPTFNAFSEWKQQSRSFEAIGLAGADAFLTVHGPDGAERIRCQGFDVDLLPLLGIEPMLGRRLLKEDMGKVFSTTALISYDFWQRRYGGNKDVLGEKIALEDGALTIVGVMAPGFWLLPQRNDVDLWSGFDLSSMPTSRFLFKIGRLKTGVTIDQARAELAAISRRTEESQLDSEKGWVPRIRPLREAYLGPFQEQAYFLLGAVGFVLLIACTNIANLLLARGTARRKELAVRASVGGGRLRLVRQLLTESVLLSVLGGAFGLMLTVWGIQAFVSAAPQWFPLTEEVRIDGAVLGFTAGISLLSGLLFGLLPALQISKGALAEMLKEGGRSLGMSAGRSSRSILLVSEIALAIVLLAGASLMIRGYLKERNANLGYDPHNLLTMNFRLGGKQYYSDVPGGSVRVTQQPARYYQQLLENIRGVPGVVSAGVTSSLPVWGPRWQTFEIVGRAAVRPEDRPTAAFNEVDPGLFDALKIPLFRGRLLSEQDNRSSPWVIVVNETFARRFFPDVDPLGQEIRLTMETGAGGTNAEAGPARVIVGVVTDVRYPATDEDPPPAVYSSYLQHPWEFPHGTFDFHLNKTLVVRTSVNPMSLAPAIRKIAAAVDLTQAPFDVVTMEQRLADVLSAPRFLMQLLGLFAIFAVVLAAVGIYGVMSYFVTQRRRELAVRAALGAQKRDLTRLVVNGSLKVTLVGAALGCLATLGLSKFLARFLFGVESADLSFLLLVTVLMMLVGLIASYIPARRAAKIDPTTALRDE